MDTSLALKVSGDGHGPLQRGEWNWRIKSDVPDLNRLTPTPIAPILPTIRAASLQPMFTTDIQRTARQLHLDKCTTVEAVFDEGCITANGSILPIAELELELKSGDAQPLYQLALNLLGSVPLALALLWHLYAHGAVLYAPGIQWSMRCVPRVVEW